jgi:NitT/TauT family transport system substrate-binding protein
VRIQEIGFTQVAALREDNVDVVSGYINNEPIQLRNAGVNVNVLAVSELYPLASDHLIVSEQTLSTDRILVEKFTRALLRGMNRVNEDPDAAFTVALSAIPEANRVDPMLGVAILKETVRLWQPENFGVIQEPNWANTQRLLIDMKLISADVSLTDAYDTSFVSR